MRVTSDVWVGFSVAAGLEIAFEPMTRVEQAQRDVGVPLWAALFVLLRICDELGYSSLNAQLQAERLALCIRRNHLS